MEEQKGPVRVRHFQAEDVCQAHVGHEHNYDHATVVISGRVRVTYRYMQDGQEVTGESREYHAGEWIVILKDVRHTIKPLEPGTRWDCVYLNRDFNGMAVERYIGNDKAYV